MTNSAIAAHGLCKSYGDVVSSSNWSSPEEPQPAQHQAPHGGVFSA